MRICDPKWSRIQIIGIGFRDPFLVSTSMSYLKVRSTAAWAQRIFGGIYPRTGSSCPALHGTSSHQLASSPACVWQTSALTQHEDFWAGHWVWCRRREFKICISSMHSSGTASFMSVCSTKTCTCSTKCKKERYMRCAKSAIHCNPMNQNHRTVTSRWHCPARLSQCLEHCSDQQWHRQANLCKHSG